MSAYTYQLRPRYNECDPQGVVFHAEYFVYSDVAITEFFREIIGPPHGASREGTELVVGHAAAPRPIR